jgi:hypothetical protein
MAALAGLRESSRNMIRHRPSERRGALPGSDVASVAGCGIERVVVAHMAGNARRRRRGNVHPRQGKPRRAVIERRGPARWCMAIGAVRQRESRPGGGVHRGIRLLPGDQMAAGGSAFICGDIQGEVATDMALLARHVGMAQGQRKTDRRRIMPNRRTQPSVKARMALLAFVRGEFRRGAGVRGRRRALPILHVTGRASSRESHELPDGSALVTLVALHDRMRSKQRKSVEVILNGLHRHVPAAHRVALGTVGAELTAMNIRVAVRAVFADIGEDGPEVALRAIDFFVHSAKRISRGVVAEFWNGANGGPACVRVTVLAGDRQWAMRTAPGLVLCIRRADESKCKY